MAKSRWRMSSPPRTRAQRAQRIWARRMSEQIAVEVAPGRKVTAIVYPAAKREQAGIILTLGHGAGAGQGSSFMVSSATALAARGIETVTFNFLYMEQGRRLPDSNEKLEACYRAVIDTVAQRNRGRGRLAIGGKSMGGRIASHVAAAGAPDVAGGGLAACSRLAPPPTNRTCRIALRSDHV